MMQKNSKYGNKKISVCGKVFDSKLEADRYLYLKALEQQKQINNLCCQVKYTLIPHQIDPQTQNIVERAISYIADFTYYKSNGEFVVEDTKGKHTNEYIIKRKLMLYIHRIRIKEVTSRIIHYWFSYISRWLS